MVDIFVVGILVSLVQLGNYMTITPGPGALAFAGVVMLTMFAAMSFEPRLLWDRLDELTADPPPRHPETKILNEEPTTPPVPSRRSRGPPRPALEHRVGGAARGAAC